MEATWHLVLIVLRMIALLLGEKDVKRCCARTNILLKVYKKVKDVLLEQTHFHNAKAGNIHLLKICAQYRTLRFNLRWKR